MAIDASKSRGLLTPSASATFLRPRSPFATGEVMGEPRASIPDRFNAAAFFVDRQVVEGRAGRSAFHQENRVVTYGEIFESVNRVGNALLDLGVQMEESIANTVHGFEDFPISDDAVLLVEGGSARAAFHDLTIHEEGRRIEPIRNQGGWLSHDLPGREWGAGPQEGCGSRRGKKPSGLAGFNGRILRKPEHVGLTSHSARAAPRRVLRSGRSETMGLPGETESCRRSERARRT